MLTAKDPRLSGRIAFTHPDFVLYQLARFLIIVSLEMQSVAVGWQVYGITKRPLDLGLVGLAQFLPGFILFLPAGHAADRFDRRKVLISCYAGLAVCSVLLLTVTRMAPSSVHLIYAVLVLLGSIRALNWPSSRALLPQIVPEEHFANAVAWNSSTSQAGMITGPMFGGMIYALFHGPGAVYVASILVAIIAVLSTLRIHPQPASRRNEGFGRDSVFAGFRYIWQKKLILGSISLDMFAVLLGGAGALLPIYAREILKTGPWGLGLLRGAPGCGAALMAIVVAYHPIRRRAGMIMLWCVTAFGVMTIVFGLSRNLALSLLSMLLLGASDMVSVIIRATLVQLATPDEMRGRVNAVDMIFIGVSNELGEFESGLTAQWFGTVPAVILGGVGTLVVIALWAWLFPELRNADQLTVAELAAEPSAPLSAGT